MAKLLTIIVTYNAMRWVDRCLGSVKSSSVPSDIFIVDNGSTDGTADYIAEHYPDAMLYRSRKNLMFGRGNNVGLKYALEKGYEYVYLLNQDAWVMPDTFEKILSVFAKHPEYGILSPMQMAPGDAGYEMLFNILIVKKLPENYAEQMVCDIDFVQAAHWMISRECIEEVGGFSPSFPHYGEDNNYCDRVIYHGFKVGVVPSASAVHDASNKPLITNSQKRYRHYINFVIKMSSLKDEGSTMQRLVFLLRRAKGLVVEQHTLTAFGAFFKMLASLSFILKNRRVSASGKCAFLN